MSLAVIYACDIGAHRDSHDQADSVRSLRVIDRDLME